MLEVELSNVTLDIDSIPVYIEEKQIGISISIEQYVALKHIQVG